MYYYDEVFYRLFLHLDFLTQGFFFCGNGGSDFFDPMYNIHAVMTRI